jgi:lactoylglutathione lyase
LTVLDHIGLSVADLDAEADWYASALGLEKREPGEIPALGIRVVFLVDPHTGWALELLQRDGSVAGPPVPDAPTALLTQGYGHICLRVNDVDRTFAALVAAGAAARMPPSPAPVPGVRMAFVADPEGHLIEILDRPGPPGTPPRRQESP